MLREMLPVRELSFEGREGGGPKPVPHGKFFFGLKTVVAVVSCML